RPPSADAVVQEVRGIERLQHQRGACDLAAAVAASGAGKRPPRKAWPALAVIGAAAALVLALFVVLLAMARPRDGTVSLDTDETDVEIALVNQGREAAVLDRKSHPEVRLAPGDYDVEVRKSRDGLRLSA